MIYFYALPVVVVGALLVSVLWQQATTHFVEPASLKRLAILIVLAWASLGWLLEAAHADAVVRTALTCQEEIHAELTALQARVQEFLD